MKNVLLVIVAALTFVSCDEISGKLDVRESFSLKAKKGTLVLEEGTIDAKIDFTGKRTAYLKANGKKVKIKLKRGQKFPSNGEFNFPAAKTNLNVDLTGDATRDVTYGPERTNYEECSESYPVTRCNRRGECRTVYVYEYGTRLVTYRYNTIDEELRINIEKDASILATFEAAKTYTRRDELRRGFCRIDRRRYPRRRYNTHYDYY